MALNCATVVVKLVVGFRTHSLSVLGASLESGLDVLNNIIGMAVVRVAARGPDDDHPYGHEKFETVGALAIVGFLSISCFALLREAVDHLINRPALRAPTSFEVILLAMTLAVNAFVVWYERRRGRALDSEFLLADAEHTQSDIYVTAAALGSLMVARAGIPILDPVLAIVVALVIAWNGYQIVRRTVPVLVDARGVDASEIRRVVGGIPQVADVRAVRSRAGAGGVVFVEVTIGVAAGRSVAEAHAIADVVETRLQDALGTSEVIVHVEPA